MKKSILALMALLALLLCSGQRCDLLPVLGNSNISGIGDNDDDFDDDDGFDDFDDDDEFNDDFDDFDDDDGFDDNFDDDGFDDDDGVQF